MGDGAHDIAIKNIRNKLVVVLSTELKSIFACQISESKVAGIGTKRNAPRNRNSAGALLEPFAVGLQSWADLDIQNDQFQYLSRCTSRDPITNLRPSPKMDA